MVILVQIELPLMVLAPMAWFIFPSDDLRTRSFPLAVSTGWLGICWLAGAHYVHSRSLGWALQALGFIALFLSVGFFTVSSADRVVTAVTSIPFIVLAVIRFIKTTAKFSTSTLSEFTYTLQELILFIASFGAFLFPLACLRKP